jgi:ABC-2 type transport system permease protein
MNPSTVAIRAGVRRGWIELRQSITTGEILGWMWPSIIAVIVLYVLSDRTIPGASFSVGSHAIPGYLGMNLVFTGMLGLSVALTMEREDGTLLRMKATPNGTLGYLIGKVVAQASLTVAMLLVVLIPASFLFDGLELRSASSWLMLAWVLVLGLVATLPLGAIFGSLFTSAQSVGLVSLAVMGLAAISGVFYPLTALPEWLQWIGQAFPLYWLGLGMRSALLPDAMAAAEVGGSWRHLETIVALEVWAILGFVVAPIVLRRMARRESGSRVGAPVSEHRATADARHRRP